MGARDAENEPPEKLTTIGAPVTRQPSAALNGSMAWIEQEPESRSPAASVIVPVTVVVCAAAAHDQRRRIAIRIFRDRLLYEREEMPATAAGWAFRFDLENECALCVDREGQRPTQQTQLVKGPHPETGSTGVPRLYKYSRGHAQPPLNHGNR